MPFTEAQTQSLLAQKGIGKTVLQRLREMGSKLAQADAADILEQGAALTGATCWKNSPQAKAAVAAAIAWAETQLSEAD